MNPTITRLSPTTALTGGRDYLSYSAVSLFQACPLRFYFKYVLGLPEETVTASLLFGQAVHAAVQFHYEQLLAGQPPPDLDVLLGVFQDQWATQDPGAVQYGKGEGRDTFGLLADRVLAAFQDSTLARPEGVILGVEEELRGPVVPGCPDLLARVNLLVQMPDALQVTDFKTSRSVWGLAKLEEAAPQLLLYHELARTLADDKPVRLAFAILTKTKSPQLILHDVPADPQQIARTQRTVERVWHAIEAGHVYPSPSPVQCPTCPFRGPCRAWTG